MSINANFAGICMPLFSQDSVDIWQPRPRRPDDQTAPGIGQSAISADLCSNSEQHAGVGQIRPGFGQTSPVSAELGSNSVKFGPGSETFARFRLNPARSGSRQSGPLFAFPGSGHQSQHGSGHNALSAQTQHSGRWDAASARCAVRFSKWCDIVWSVDGGIQVAAE